METDSDFKNALPSEVDDHPDSGSFREARATGLTRTPEVVYGESDEDPNRVDQIDEHRGAETEAE
jgi:hypothetical protein